jgi:hypothetical protein
VQVDTAIPTGFSIDGRKPSLGRLAPGRTELLRQSSISRLAVVIAVVVGSAFIAPYLVSPGGCLAQESNPSVTLSPAGLVRAAVDHEVAAANDTSVKHMFRSRKQNPRGSQTKLYVETREALAGMVIAYNDQPLTPQQQQGEQDHLNGVGSDPEQLRRKAAREKEDTEHTLRIVKALPDAFLFEYDSTKQSSVEPGKNAGSMVRLKFHPNPNYDPPSRVEQVLVGMQGYVVIDAAAHRVATIDGTLFKDVTFGWGVLGHLDQGGHFLVQQADLGDGTWSITHMSLSFTGKVLLFKSISITSDEDFSDFRQVPPDTAFAQGVELLKAEQAKLAQNSGTQPRTH